MTQEINSTLTSPFSCEEIRVATFVMGGDKVPEPDGMPGSFYQDQWDLVSEDVC